MSDQKLPPWDTRYDDITGHEGIESYGEDDEEVAFASTAEGRNESMSVAAGIPSEISFNEEAVQQFFASTAAAATTATANNGNLLQPNAQHAAATAPQPIVSDTGNAPVMYQGLLGNPPPSQLSMPLTTRLALTQLMHNATLAMLQQNQQSHFQQDQAPNQPAARASQGFASAPLTAAAQPVAPQYQAPRPSNSTLLTPAQAAIHHYLTRVDAVSATALSQHEASNPQNMIVAQPPPSSVNERRESYRRLLYLAQDEYHLSPYQCLLRKQIEIFEATQEDLVAKKQGRNRPIVKNQIGIRCIHCSLLPPDARAKGDSFFPSQLIGLYQTAQNMAKHHLIEYCKNIPPSVREDLLRVRQRDLGAKTRKSAYGGGREYWANCLSLLGIESTNDKRLFLRRSPPAPFSMP